MEKLVQDHYYLKFTLCACIFCMHTYVHFLAFPRLFDKTPDFVLDKNQLKTIILYALQTLHGQVRE